MHKTFTQQRIAQHQRLVKSNVLSPHGSVISGILNFSRITWIRKSELVERIEFNLN